MPTTQTRRRFLTTLSLAGAVSLLGPAPALAAEGALETTTIRLAKIANVCIAPQYLAEELLRAEGFTDVRYVQTPRGGLAQAIGRGEVDFSLDYAASFAAAIDGGEPIAVLTGVMVGCVEVFANAAVQHGRFGESECNEDPHRTAFAEETLTHPTVPLYQAFNPAMAQIDAEHVFSIAMLDVMNNGMTPEQAIDKAFKRVEEIFAKYPITQA